MLWELVSLGLEAAPRLPHAWEAALPVLPAACRCFWCSAPGCSRCTLSQKGAGTPNPHDWDATLNTTYVGELVDESGDGIPHLGPLSFAPVPSALEDVPSRHVKTQNVLLELDASRNRLARLGKVVDPSHMT